jgi:phosphoglycerate dehydrogenase-like enzyme
MKRLQALYILHEEAFEMVYGPQERARISQLVDIYAPPQTERSILKQPKLLAPAQVLISGWGGPTLTPAILEAAPSLEAVFFGAGSISGIMTYEAWDRGIVISSAYAANALPVAEYALASILFSLKHGWYLSNLTRRLRKFPRRDGAPGCFGRTVGLVSLGTIARTLLRLLKPFDLEVLVYDPFVSAEEAARLGVELTSLADLFRRADVVSIHSPLLPETEGMITGAHIASMKNGATLINTARGAVVREDELIHVATRRDDLQFVLDVAQKEPPDPDSPLYSLPNVVLTPHIAGSVGQECRRMGQYMVEELERYVHGQPLQWQVTPEMAARSSHRPATDATPRPAPAAQPVARSSVG